jgi:hypothetical protein
MAQAATQMSQIAAEARGGVMSSSGSPIPATLRWQSYNCYSSAIGALLARRGYALLSSILDSRWDFYYTKCAPLSPDGAGVWAGPEHSGINQSIRTAFGIEALARTVERTTEFCEMLADLCSIDNPIVVTVQNLSLGYIPGCSLIGSACHYLLAIGCCDRSINVYDPVFDRSYSMPLAALAAASRFTTSSGEVVHQRVLTLRDDHGSVSGTSRPTTRRAIGRCFLRPSLAQLLPDAGHVLLGSAAVTALADDLDKPTQADVYERLQIVSQRLKEAHYQRRFFLRALGEIQQEFPAVQRRVPDAARILDGVVQGWFQAKTLMLYVAQKACSRAFGRLSPALRRLAEKERQAEQVLGQVDSVLSAETRGHDCTCR